jgi:hypothetical protein
MPALRAIALPVVLLAIAAAAAFACAPQAPAANLGDQNQAGSGGGQGQETSTTVPKPAQTTPKALNDTCIGKAGFTFDDGQDCDKCMSDQDGCCQKLVACFKDDPQCAALQKCVDDCSGTGGGTGGGDAGPSGPGKTVFVSELYPSINPTCGSCHAAGTGGAPIFFGATADATYTLFRAQGFQVGGELVNKGPHAGPPLQAAQVALVQKWQTAEGGGGGGTGTGTGGGMGDGGGGADAGLTGKQCKDACKVQYAAALPTWDAYHDDVQDPMPVSCNEPVTSLRAGAR